jgi:hypothetical protein
MILERYLDSFFHSFVHQFAQLNYFVFFLYLIIVHYTMVLYNHLSTHIIILRQKNFFILINHEKTTKMNPNSINISIQFHQQLFNYSGTIPTSYSWLFNYLTDFFRCHKNYTIDLLCLLPTDSSTQYWQITNKQLKSIQNYFTIQHEQQLKLHLNNQNKQQLHLKQPK